MKNERNRQIYIDKTENAMSYSKLSKKYGLSIERCRQIYIKECRKIENRNAIDNNPVTTLDILFHHYPNVGNHIIVRSFNSIARKYDADKKRKLYTDFQFFCRELNEKTEEDLIEIRNLGRKSVSFLMMVKIDFCDSHLKQPS